VTEFDVENFLDTNPNINGSVIGCGGGGGATSSSNIDTPQCMLSKKVSISLKPAAVESP